MRMAVAKRIHGDTGRKIEILLAALAIQIRPFPSNRPHPTPGINGHQRGYGHRLRPCALLRDFASKSERRPEETAFRASVIQSERERGKN
jgi:hypothetical protein